jgi:type IV secretion system protein VirB9
MSRLLTILLLSTSGLAVSAELPTPVAGDKRLREITYREDQVTTINIIKGVGTRIMLSRDEKIRAAAPGFGADCAVKEHDWCIVANTGDSDIYVKAKSGATAANNLELTTDKRVYSFDFLLNPAHKRELDGMFRVTFRYPGDLAASVKAAGIKDGLAEKLEAPTLPKNWKYTMEIGAGGDIIAPSRVFDDGRFMHLSFPNNRLMPEIFVVEADGSESLPASHVEKDTIVIHRVYKKLVLRRDKAVVGIWNDAYDADGVAPLDGTTVPGMKRIVRRQE